MTHRNAPLTPEGRRRLARLIVEEGWSCRRAAERFQVSPEREHQILELRTTHRWGPHRIGYQLRILRSTVGRVLARHQMPLLRHLDQATGLPVRAPKPVRYEMTAPGHLVHVDSKKLGRIPDGGGHRMLSRSVGNRNTGKGGRGYAYLHHAIDSYSRVVYSEILGDERKETAAGFWGRANGLFTSIGVTVTGVMTDNGACYRSRAFAAALGDTIRHRRTRRYRPQTNGKVERFNRTLLAEWAYATTYRSDEARATTYPDWIHWYNHHRHHTGIGGLTPAQRVHNLTGKYS